MKYEDLKCEFCDGHGETDIDIDGIGAPRICSFCEGTGIDQDQLASLPKFLNLKNALRGIESVCDNQNPSHEMIWRIAHDALNPK